jgi:hypothetical protein
MFAVRFVMRLLTHLVARPAIRHNQVHNGGDDAENAHDCHDAGRDGRNPHLCDDDYHHIYGLPCPYPL